MVTLGFFGAHSVACSWVVAFVSLLLLGALGLALALRRIPTRIGQV